MPPGEEYDPARRKHMSDSRVRRVSLFVPSRHRPAACNCYHARGCKSVPLGTWRLTILTARGIEPSGLEYDLRFLDALRRAVG